MSNWIGDSKVSDLDRIADLERKLLDAQRDTEHYRHRWIEDLSLAECEEYKALQRKLAKAREVIKPIADVYAEALEQRTGPFADRKYDLFTLQEETVQRAAQWYKDNQPEKERGDDPLQQEEGREPVKERGDE